MLLFMEDAAPVQSVVSVFQVAPLAALPCYQGLHDEKEFRRCGRHTVLPGCLDDCVYHKDGDFVLREEI